MARAALLPSHGHAVPLPLSCAPLPASSQHLPWLPHVTSHGRPLPAGPTRSSVFPGAARCTQVASMAEPQRKLQQAVAEGSGGGRQSAPRRKPVVSKAQVPRCLWESRALTKAQDWPSEAPAALLSGCWQSLLWLMGTSKWGTALPPDQQPLWLQLSILGGLNSRVSSSQNLPLCPHATL